MKIKFLNIPDVRQFSTYDCGASSLLSVLAYYGKYDGTESKLAKELNTNSKDGTKPNAILRVAKKYGLKGHIENNSSIENLKKYFDKKIPVIINYQAWTDKKNNDWKTNKADGHYSVLAGIDNNNIYLEDPSLLGKKGYIPIEEFMDRWHDEGYKNMCIVVYSDEQPDNDKLERIK